jgi:ketosteroid isomerase-like protein
MSHEGRAALRPHDPHLEAATFRGRHRLAPLVHPPERYPANRDTGRMGDGTEALIRSLYATWNAEGVETFRSHCTEDVAWHDDPQVPDATTSKGIERVVSRFQGLIDTIGHFQIDVQQLGELDDGRRYSVVQVTARGQGSGAVVEEEHLHVLRVADGLVAEFWLHLDVERARREFGLASD